MLSDIMRNDIDKTNDNSIKENCLCSRGGIYSILNIKIILEINITVNKNIIEVQSIKNLIGMKVEYIEIKGNSIEINVDE